VLGFQQDGWTPRPEVRIVQSETGSRERATYEGTGETLDDAFLDAAERAVADSRDNIGRTFEVVRHTVTVDNPRISEHRVVINST
jgi:uncharacterized protein YbbK (DUF523 family)